MLRLYDYSYLRRLFLDIWYSKEAINRFKDVLKTKWYMFNLRLISFDLGIAVSQNRENKIIYFRQ